MYSPTTAIPNKKEFNCTHQYTADNLNILIAGLGGLGVVSLSQKLRNLVAKRYSYVHTIEQRGVAQRRSTTSAAIRAANHYIAPSLSNTKANSCIALEALEALRYAHLLEKHAQCLISDYQIDLTSSTINAPSADEIKMMLEKKSVHCLVLPITDWLKKEQMLPVHASTAMLGAFCASLNIDHIAAEAFMHQNFKDNKNKKAFQWGFEQYHQLQNPVTHTAKTYLRASARKFSNDTIIALETAA